LQQVLAQCDFFAVYHVLYLTEQSRTKKLAKQFGIKILIS